MSLEKKYTYLCDLCGVEKITSGTAPEGWALNIVVTAGWRKATADFCQRCHLNTFPVGLDYGFPDKSKVPKDEFAKPWWKKFWGPEVKRG